ncbi:GntR family transcriptional regulator [Acidisphaera sp. S103]|uniref:GntR family transcriptional regulator n=1 Tax=Acidisphaera sp. S103 TaxID=1747223 RepID=UPI00131E932C|nr:GntR family transcriptional regulator [Acidisphaera sp. S103]
MGSIVRSTLAEQAYFDLREQIMSGRLPAGHRLLPEELSLTLAISATPIKEALVKLDQDGLVAMETRRGAVVRRFTAADVRNLYEARELIELHAMSRAFAERRIDRALSEHLHATQANLLAYRAQGTEAGLIDALAQDRAFHRLIVALSNNQTLVDWHERVMMQTHTVRVYSLATYPLERLAAEHAAVIAAVRDADATAARAALERHLVLSRDEILSRLPDGDGVAAR